MSNLHTLSRSLGDLVEKLSPSLVTVVGRRVNATATVWKEGGLFVTANHNLPRRDSPVLRLPDGSEHAAQTLGRDPSTDLALLKVEGLDLPVPAWADEGGRVGEIVLALANSGSGPRATMGLVTRASGPWRSRWGGDVDRWLEVDGSLPRGFSGGPLVAADGALLGLNTRGLVRGGTTLTTPTLKRVLGLLETEGRVRQGYLGVGAQPVEGGLLVNAVVSGSPAEAGGLKVGDVLVEGGGEELRSLQDLFALLSGHVESEVELSILRGGEAQTLSVTPSERKRRRC